MLKRLRPFLKNGLCKIECFIQMTKLIKDQLRQGKQEAPQPNKNGYSRSRATNQVGPTSFTPTSRGTHTFSEFQPVID